MFRFIHAADLHLGKPFGTLPDDVRGPVRLARDGQIARLAAAARDCGAAHVLLAGDTFDAETPAPRTIRQLTNAVAAVPDVTFVMLPGNHDSLAALALWDRLVQDRPGNLMLAVTPEPVVLAPAVLLLPAPVTTRRPGLDLTGSLQQATPAGALRIGLAHGAVVDFGARAGEDGSPATIPPDRATRAGLDYLALGDWHGQMQVGPATWYAGTPEPDSFRHDAPGRALAVALAGPGQAPQVDPVLTGALRWQACDLTLVPGSDSVGLLQAALPPVADRGTHLLQVRLKGRIGLAARQALGQLLVRVAPDFLSLEVRDDSQPDILPDDLDLIDRAGALRQAAERLVAEARDPGLLPGERDRAARALAHLFSLAAGVAR